MSAGICIMNKDAIAMAADSAVTIGNHAAIHNSANKLFALSYVAPVGAIVYSNSELMNIPMEVIVKEFKKSLSNKTYRSLEEYVKSFILHLEHNGDFYRFNRTESDYILNSVYEFLQCLCNEYQILLNNHGDGKKEISCLGMDIKQKLVSKYTSFVKNTQKTEHYNYINEQYCSTIEQILLNEEQLQWLDTSQRKELLDCLLHLFDSNYESSRYTGIAIAGFGDSEVFPHMVHIHIEGIINGKVRYKLIEMVEISEQNKSAIIPLAQTDVIQTFLFGSSDQLLNELANRMSNYISENINAIDESLFAPGKRNDVSNVICNLSKMHDCIYSFIHDKYLYPIISSIAGLPVEELSLLAESLINITSIKRKFTIDQNIGTVGGPIDVSIITRGDGFIWRKRKHYFEPKYNPHFFSSHYNYNIVEHALNDDV